MGSGFVLSYLEQSDKEVNSGDLSEKLNVSAACIAALLKKWNRTDI